MVRIVMVSIIVCVLPDAPVRAQEASALAPHPASARWWLSGQANLIFQWHDAFPSPYHGTNSLRPAPEHALSRLLTLYTGVRIGNATEVLFDVESAGGRGISDALGLAGFTNLDVVRNPTLGAKPYVARLFVHRTIALSKETTKVERGPLSLASEAPLRRIEIRVGKFSTADWFDVNTVGSDSRLQFENWTADNNGAYDYAADTRGYTDGVEVEYQDRAWALRFGEMLMPKVANGIDLDWDVARARAENVELEVRRGLVPGREGAVRLLTYLNHANMGSYADALAQARATGGIPAIEQTRMPGRTKAGVGLNVEQTVADGVRLFGRWGWNEGRHESFAYTEVNRATEFGGDVRGDRWSRGGDKLGVAMIVNALSDDHRAYLAAGGLGFLLGDGRLTYGPERIVEFYYTARVRPGVYASVDVQHIVHPGYNRDRGPVLVPGLRLHLEL